MNEFFLIGVRRRLQFISFFKYNKSFIGAVTGFGASIILTNKYYL